MPSAASQIGSLLGMLPNIWFYSLESIIGRASGRLLTAAHDELVNGMLKHCRDVAGMNEQDFPSSSILSASIRPLHGEVILEFSHDTQGCCPCCPIRAIMGFGASQTPESLMTQHRFSA
jgi:hypothetical protein